MAGTDSRFDAAAFRTNIRFAMNMGLPVPVDERPTFIWDTVRTYTNEDAGGTPFSWTDTPATQTSYPDVQIPCAVEFTSGTSRDTAVGEFDSSRVVITILDEDFAELTVGDVPCNKVKLGGDFYEIDFVAPPVGLFEVTVYQVHAKAIDES